MVEAVSFSCRMVDSKATGDGTNGVSGRITGSDVAGGLRRGQQLERSALCSPLLSIP